MTLYEEFQQLVRQCENVRPALWTADMTFTIRNDGALDCVRLRGGRCDLQMRFSPDETQQLYRFLHGILAEQEGSTI
jgi:hypothetical protein